MSIFQFDYDSGLTTLYATFRNPAGQMRDVVTPATEAINTAHWPNYKVALVEQGTGTGIYFATYPAGVDPSTAEWIATIQNQAGGSAVASDPKVGCGTVGPGSAATLLAPSEHTLIAGSDLPAALNAGQVDGFSIPHALQFIAAMVAGKVSGAGSGTETFKGLDGTTTRVVVTVDSNGNRTMTTYTPASGP